MVDTPKPLGINTSQEAIKPSTPLAEEAAQQEIPGVDELQPAEREITALNQDFSAATAPRVWSANAAPVQNILQANAPDKITSS